MVLMMYINPEYTELKPENLNLNVVYEDADLMVVNKPPNMVVHPGVGKLYRHFIKWFFVSYATRKILL